MEWRGLIIIYLIVLILGILLLIVEYKFNFLKINNDSEYGSARFATFKEIKEKFTEEEVSNINESGFPIWYSKDNKKVWFDKETPHYVYLGSTGSGKSVTCVIPMCSFISTAKKKRSVFITDPKGEIFNTTSKMFKDNGYEIFTIDFRNPELSNKINLLEPIIKEYEEYIKYDDIANEINTDINVKSTSIEKLKEQKNSKNRIDKLNNEISELEKKLIDNQNIAMRHLAETNRLITSLSSMIMTDKNEKDPFWNNSARNLLEGIISLYLEEYREGKIKREQITLNSIKKFQNSSTEETNFEILKTHIEKKPYGLKSKDSLTSILSTAENTYKSITGTFGEKMSLFDDVNVANITSQTDFEFDILGKKPTAIYIIVPDEDKTYYSLITIIVGLLYRELVKLANSNSEKKLPVNIDWILDEFANCPPLSDIEAIVSVARSRGMRFHFFIQSLSQLDNVYGKEVSQIILDNCGLVYLKTNTQSTAEEISKRLGKKTIESKSYSQNMAKSNFDGNKSVSLMGRDLLTPEEVKQLHFKTIIFPTIGYPVFRSTVIYKKFSCYSSGEIDRKKRRLEDLSYTYFTVERLNPKIKKQRYKEENEMTTDTEEFYEEMKVMYTDINNSIKEIIDNQKYKQTFEIENGNLYSCFILENLLSGDEREKIQNLESIQFHIEMKEIKDYTKINIYRKL